MNIIGLTCVGICLVVTCASIVVACYHYCEHGLTRQQLELAEVTITKQLERIAELEGPKPVEQIDCEAIAEARLEAYRHSNPGGWKEEADRHRQIKPCACGKESVWSGPSGEGGPWCPDCFAKMLIDNTPDAA